MKTVSDRRKYLILLLLLLGPGVILIYLANADHKFKTLPYFGEREWVAGSPDTIYHRVPDITLIDQDSLPFHMSDMDGKIVVADFFFTTCPSICPIMTMQMTRLQWVLEDPAFKDVRFLSHTVNPKNDTPAVLKAYAKQQGADLNLWTFVTGDEEVIWNHGFEGYLISAQQDDAAPGGFLHSSMFVLLDRERHIRGFYDGTSTAEVDNLVIDIKMLLKEEKMKESEKLKA